MSKGKGPVAKQDKDHTYDIALKNWKKNDQYFNGLKPRPITRGERKKLREENIFINVESLQNFDFDWMDTILDVMYDIDTLDGLPDARDFELFAMVLRWTLEPSEFIEIKNS